MDEELRTLAASLRQLDQRLARQHTFDLQDRYRSGTARIQWGLWPLWLGQCVQVALGLICIGLGVSVWSALRDGSAVFWSAIIAHVYGVVCIAGAGIILGLLARIDRSEPLLLTQTRLARLRHAYIVSGMVVGLSWWLFWLPFMATFFYWLAEADLYANLGAGVVGTMLGVGVLGVLASGWFHRWSRRPGHPRLTRAMDNAVTGRSLISARRRLEELKAFANE